MELSIVIPVFNEAESLERLLNEITYTLMGSTFAPYEVIFVDDGSTDESMEVLKLLSQKDERIKVLALRRNFGQTAAMYAGFKASRGRIVVPLDADGQNDPADIPVLASRLQDGFECVSGWRVNRQDKGLSRKLPSLIANRLISRATGVPIHDSGCTIKAYDGDFLRQIPLYGEMHRLIPFYIYLAGGRVTELPVGHRARVHGISKYGIGRTFKVLQDVAVARVHASFGRRPMHLFGNLGIVSMLLGGVSMFIALYLKATGTLDLVETPLVILASLFILAGIQVFMAGLLAEIILRKLTIGAGDYPFAIRSVITSGKDDLQARATNGSDLKS